MILKAFTIKAERLFKIEKKFSRKVAKLAKKGRKGLSIHKWEY